MTLDHLAGRVVNDPQFLACPLADYARSESLDDDGLATALGCAAAELARLRLSGVPRAEAFRADVTALADRFGIAPVKLAEVVHRGQTLFQLRAAHTGAGEAGFLLPAGDGDSKLPPDANSKP